MVERDDSPLPGDLCIVSTARAKCVWVCQIKPPSRTNKRQCVTLSLICCSQLHRLDAQLIDSVSTQPY